MITEEGEEEDRCLACHVRLLGGTGTSPCGGHRDVCAEFVCMYFGDDRWVVLVLDDRSGVSIE